MPRLKRPRLTYANVVASLALFVALGGTSYAAVTITGRDVKNSSLTGADVKNSSLTGADVKNSSLSGADLRNGSVTSADVRDRSLRAVDFKIGELPAGAPGTDGVDGLDGADGAPGSPAASMLAARIVGLPSLSPGVAVHFGAINGSSSAAGSSAAVTMVSPAVAVTARDLSVVMTGGVLGGNRVVTLLVDDAPTALSCMATGSESTCSNTTAEVAIPASSVLALEVESAALNPFTLPATDVLVTWRAIAA